VRPTTGLQRLVLLTVLSQQKNSYFGI